MRPWASARVAHGDVATRQKTLYPDESKQQVAVRRLFEISEVEARAEVLAFALEHEQARASGVCVRHGVDERFHELGRKCIHLLRSAERKGPGRVLLLDVQHRRHLFASVTRSEYLVIVLAQSGRAACYGHLLAGELHGRAECLGVVSIRQREGLHPPHVLHLRVCKHL